MVALKRLDRRRGQGDRDSGRDEMILVYEYASRGSLYGHLKDINLTWTQQLKICLDAAKGLSYLHDPRDTYQRLIHCDIKSANILLDDNFNAKVADFRISKIGLANQQNSILVTRASGTHGYCDPVFMETYTLTKESDVYSFRVVLFEVLCGKLCIEYSKEELHDSRLPKEYEEIVKAAVPPLNYESLYELKVLLTEGFHVNEGKTHTINMEAYYKRKTPSSSTSNHVSREPTREKPSTQPINVTDLNDLPWDPIDRPRISQYNVNQRDDIRRKYWERKPCQPRAHDFKRTIIGNKLRRFLPSWFDLYGNWLEYSVKAEKAFCLCCYLFRDDIEHRGGNEAFVTQGFNGWNKTERFIRHVGDFNSFHNRALEKCEALMCQNQSVAVAFNRRTEQEKRDYRIRLHVSVIAARYCLNGELSFRGHDENVTSLYRGNYLELVKLIGIVDKNIGEVLKRAPKNCQLLSPKIQKEIATCFEAEVLEIIFKEIGDDVFALLVDESSDVTKKEQMAIVFRYVNKNGLVKESLVGIIKVKETSSAYLKSSIDKFFAKNHLSLKQLRGQGYDGASNMCGEFNGLKAKILEENNSAYYVHCFAHQLQLVVVAVARKHLGVVDFFDKLSLVTNVVCASCKRKDILIECEKVLEFVENKGNNGSTQNQASGILVYFESFDFVFYLHLMKYILGLTNILSQALQKRDQDVVEAVSLVESAKEQLKDFRVNGFVPLLTKISSFCDKHNIKVLNMDEVYVNPSGGRRRVNITNRYFFEVECFNTVVDMQIQEFSDRFSEASTELLTNVACLNPLNSFAQFDISKLVRLSELYPNDFDSVQRMELECQLNLYYANVTKDNSFCDLNSIAHLATMMVKKRKHISYPLVYRLLKLALILPVATAKKEVLANVKDEDVMKRFQNMTDRRGEIFPGGRCYHYDDEFIACVRSQYVTPQISYTLNLVFLYELEWEVNSYNPLRYKIEGEDEEKVFIIYPFTHMSEDGWLIVPIYQFTSQHKTADLQFEFQYRLTRLLVTGIERTPTIDHVSGLHVSSSGCGLQVCIFPHSTSQMANFAAKYSIMTQEMVDSFCDNFYIPTEVHPTAPGRGKTITQFPVARVSHFEVLTRVLNLSPSVTVFRAFYTRSYSDGLFCFSKPSTSAPSCFPKPPDSIKNWPFPPESEGFLDSSAKTNLRIHTTVESSSTLGILVDTTAAAITSTRAAVTNFATDVNPDLAGPSQPEGSEGSGDYFYEPPTLDPSEAKRWYVSRWNITNDSLLDDGFSCRTLVDRVAPPSFFSALCTMDYNQLYTEFNVGAARLLEEKDLEILMLKSQLAEKEAEAAEVIRLRDQVSSLSEEKSALTVEVSVLKVTVTQKDHDISLLNSHAACLASTLDDAKVACAKAGDKITSLTSERDRLAFEVSSLHASFQDFKERMEIQQEEQAQELFNRVAELEAHGTLGHALGRAVDFGLQEGLEAGYKHGTARRNLLVVDAYNPEAAKASYIDAVKALEDVDFPLVNLLKSKKDAGMDEVLDCFLLDGALAGLPEAACLQPCIEQLSIPIYHEGDKTAVGETSMSFSLMNVHARAAGAKKHVAALRQLMMEIVSAPLSSQTWVGEASTSVAPFFVGDYDEKDTDEALASAVAAPKLKTCRF
ncbi:zinc finger MYM-type protein 1-like protein [Tanacetum coccineum]